MADIDSIVDDIISPEDITTFETKYNNQLARGQPSCLASFEYAHCLIRSRRHNDIKLGIKLLEGLCHRDEEDVTRRECIFYLAIANTRLSEYERADQWANLLLANEPHNNQAQSLVQVIATRKRNAAIKGGAILGGVALIGGVLGAALLAGLSASRR